MVTRMLSILLIAAGVACQGALPNPEPSAAPAAWMAERDKVTKENTPAGAAKAGVPQPAPAEPQKPAAQPAAQPATQAPAAGPLVIARVAGEAIDVNELIQLAMHRDSGYLFQMVNRLVANRLVGLESKRLGITPDEAAVETLYKEAVAKMETELQKKKEYAGITLDKFVDSVLGLDPLRYREAMREDARRGWFAERCVRSFVLQSEHANVRVIALRSEDELKQAQADLAGGMAFEEVAKKRSADSVSAKDGGRIPPVIKGDSPMGKLAFSTAIGAIGGPDYQQGAWLLVKVDSRPKPLEGGWKEIAAEVEKSVAAEAIDDIEYKQWEATMQKRYQIDLTPILRLSGEPLR